MHTVSVILVLAFEPIVSWCAGAQFHHLHRDEKANS